MTALETPWSQGKLHIISNCSWLWVTESKTHDVKNKKINQKKCFHGGKILPYNTEVYTCFSYLCLPTWLSVNMIIQQCSKTAHKPLKLNPHECHRKVHTHRQGSLSEKVSAEITTAHWQSDIHFPRMKPAAFVSVLSTYWDYFSYDFRDFSVIPIRFCMEFKMESRTAHCMVENRPHTLWMRYITEGFKVCVACEPPALQNNSCQGDGQESNKYEVISCGGA